MSKIAIKYLVFDGNSYEYDLIVTKSERKKNYELYYSDNEIWSSSVRNTLAMKITNDGDNIMLDKKYQKLDYEELFLLRFLLNVELYFDSNDLNKEKYKIIKAEPFIEI